MMTATIQHLFFLLSVSTSNLISAFSVQTSVGVNDPSIQSKYWNYLGHNIAYEETNCNTDNTPNKGKNEPILLLNGFGVGSFHQHRLTNCLMNELQTLDRDQNIYGIDYLGQGKSWPVDCDDGQSENERDLSYSIDTWVGQVLAFIEDVVIPGHGCDDCKVHLVGNSVGGHLATILAASRPDLVRSVSLLNATPVWGLGLPGWNGRLPAPAVPKQVGRFLFDKIRDFDTIQLYLGQAYSRTEAFDDDLIQKIQGCTEGKGGHAAFGSIVWSSPSSKLREEGSFSALVSQLECDVLLLFGDDDEWCKPAYAKHMMKILKDRAVSSEQQPVQRYLALSNTGHCPNHEAPQSVAHAIARWVSSEDGMRDQLALIDEGESTLCFHEPWGDMDMREVDGAELEILSVPDKIMIKMLA